MWRPLDETTVGYDRPPLCVRPKPSTLSEGLPMGLPGDRSRLGDGIRAM
jgi:hypothetical protein